MHRCRAHPRLQARGCCLVSTLLTSLLCCTSLWVVKSRPVLLISPEDLSTSSRETPPGSLHFGSQRHLTSLPRHPGMHEPRHLQDGLQTAAEPYDGLGAVSADPHGDSSNGMRHRHDGLGAALAEHHMGMSEGASDQHTGLRAGLEEQQMNALNQPQHASIGHHLIAEADDGDDEVIHAEHRHLASAGPVQPEAGVQPSTAHLSGSHSPAEPGAVVAESGGHISEPIRLVACAQLKNEVPYVVEWIEFHRLQGFSHLVIYDDFSSDNISLLETLYRWRTA